MSSDLYALEPAFGTIARWFVAHVTSAGYHVAVTSTRRSVAHQQVLWDDYLAGRSDLPALPPNRSLHVRGLAFDMVIDGNYRAAAQHDVGMEWVRLGGRWSPRDPVHFQPPPGWEGP